MSAARADRLVEKLRERELDSLLVTDLVNVRYLSGFTGTNGVCVVGPELRLFITDFRYVERAQAEVPDFERARGKQDLLGDAVPFVLVEAPGQVTPGHEVDPAAVLAAIEEIAA